MPGLPSLQPPKRKYKLTRKGKTALRASALKHQPWKHSTGPRTDLGRLTASQNNLKHGLFARDAGSRRRDYIRFLNQLRDGTARPRTTSDPPVMPPPPGGVFG